MKRAAYLWLVMSAMFELIRYDVAFRLRGFGYIQKQVRGQAVAPSRRYSEKMICDALLLATCLYWKPVLCLQRSVCEVRLLRRHGVFGRLAVGYRPTPFFSHAWTEVDGRVVNGRTAYQHRLQLLYKL